MNEKNIIEKATNTKEKFLLNYKKSEKGITLVALVVTIIILIILAAVSISLVLGEHGLLKMARDGRDNYLIASNEEQAQLGQLEEQWDELINGNGNQGATWAYNHANQTVTATINGNPVTLKIGDKVNDTSTQTIEGFDGKWRVLGVENGKLLLVTNTCYAPFEGADTSMGTSYPALKLEGLADWNNGVSRLKAVGETYANSSSKFENGRSIKIEDVDRITGYNPNNTGVNDPEKSGTGTKYGQGNHPYQYGNKVTYKIISGKVNWSTDYDENNPDDATWNATTTTTFEPLGVNTPLAEGETYTVDRSDYYYYYAKTLSETSDNIASIGLARNSPAYDMLFNVKEPSYWLASPCVYANEYYAYWCFRSVTSGRVGRCNVWSSGSGSLSGAYGVRPVVSLKSDIEPSLVSTDSKTGISTYNI